MSISRRGFLTGAAAVAATLPEVARLQHLARAYPAAAPAPLQVTIALDTRVAVLSLEKLQAAVRYLKRNTIPPDADGFYYFVAGSPQQAKVAREIYGAPLTIWQAIRA